MFTPARTVDTFERTGNVASLCAETASGQTKTEESFFYFCQSSDTDPSRKRFWLSFKKRGTRHPRCTLFSTLFSSPCESLPGIRHQCAFAESVTWYLSDAITSRGRDFKPKSATELQCRENIAISADFVCCCRPGPIYSYIVHFLVATRLKLRRSADVRQQTRERLGRHGSGTRRHERQEP